MEFTGVGGGVMVAIAAGLWLVYLVPNWLKSREYRATERNALRLQQTIRVLAETAEIPDAVRAEAAARRLAAEQRAEYLEGPVAVGRPVRRTPSAVEAHAAALRIRRARAATGVGLLLALATIGVQVTLIATTGAVAGSFIVLAVAGVAAVSALGLLGRFAQVSQSRVVVQRGSDRRTSLDARPAAPVAREASAPWTPVPVPKPMYLSRASAPPVVAVDPQFELELAAAAAQRALRDAHRDIPAVQDAPAAPTPPSRFATMGIVDDRSGAAPDIDAVLARRRAAG